jgi:hypothetical protein
MPSNASHKSKGGKKDSAAKNTFNPQIPGGNTPHSQTDEPSGLNTKERDAQSGAMGAAHHIKK